MDYPLVWIVVTAISTYMLECCKPEWVWYNRLNVCYKVFMTPKLDWEDAKNFCSKRMAKLTDIYDYEEQMFIKEKLLHKASGHGIWVGATDGDEEGDWRWVDNTKVDIHRFMWWQGNPNNGEVPPILDLLLLGEDCLEISLKASYRGQLNDYNCRKDMPFICKMKDISTTTATTLQTTSIVTEQDLSTEPKDESTIPIVSALVSVFLAAFLVAGIVVYLRRYRNQKSTTNYYEDTNVTPSANENVYTCLDTSDQSIHSSASAILSNQNSIHEYHSVHFSNYESVNGNKIKMDVAGKDYLKQSTPRKY